MIKDVGIQYYKLIYIFHIWQLKVVDDSFWK